MCHLSIAHHYRGTGCHCTGAVPEISLSSVYMYLYRNLEQSHLTGRANLPWKMTVLCHSLENPQLGEAESEHRLQPQFLTVFSPYKWGEFALLPSWVASGWKCTYHYWKGHNERGNKKLHHVFTSKAYWIACIYYRKLAGVSTAKALETTCKATTWGISNSSFLHQMDKVNRWLFSWTIASCSWTSVFRRDPGVFVSITGKASNLFCSTLWSASNEYEPFWCFTTLQQLVSAFVSEQCERSAKWCYCKI